MEIHSVKMDVGAKRVTLSFSRPNVAGEGKNARTTHEKVPSFPCEDVPSKAFTSALRALHGDLCYLLELPKEVHERVTVHGVHFGHRGGRDTFQIVGGYSPDIGHISIVTPQLWEPGEEGVQGATVLTDDQVKRFRKVRIEAAKYAEGLRTPQIELPIGAEEPEPEPAEA